MKKTIAFRGSQVTFDSGPVEPRPLPVIRFPVTSLALDVSGRCNMRCIYCAENSTMPKRDVMSEEVLQKALTSLSAWSAGKKLSVHLGSGEPLLNFDAVKRVGMWAQEQRKERPVSLHITTNGMLLSEEMCAHLIEDGWRIKVSLDGDEEIHDRNRRDYKGEGTYRRIEKHVKFLSSKIADSFSTTSVLCHNTNPQDIFYSIGSLGVRNIEIVPVASIYPSHLTLTEEDIVLYREFISDYVQELSSGKNVPLLTRFMKKLQRVLGFNNSRVPCGAGRNFLAVGPDGVLYPCFRFVGIRKYELGSLDELDYEKMKGFAEGAGRPYDQREKCSECWAASLCSGPCFACAELLFHQNGEPSPDYCDMVKADCEAAVWLAHTLRERNPSALVGLLGIDMGEE